VALAGLEPVGAAEGWGRVAVSDMVLEVGLQRHLTARLFGLAAEAEYTLVIDGVTVASVVTDGDGDACLRMGSISDELPPVPDALPPAAELEVAVLVDASGAPTLEGEFVIRNHGGDGGMVYVERIRLEEANSSGSCGMARVARTESDVQSFVTHAGRLQAGVAYEVFVDSVLAGAVTADAVGHAALRLSTEDGSLPEGLQPVEDLRLVEWVDEGSVVVLSGSFTGDGFTGGERQGDGDGAGGSGDRGGDGGGDGGHGDGGQGGGGGGP
jgi:hypothetical protein